MHTILKLPSNYIGIFILLCNLCFGCDKKALPEAHTPVSSRTLIASADVSFFPEIEMSNPVFYNSNGIATPFLDILKNAGINTLRVRLWVNPKSVHSSLEEVQEFTERAKIKGFKIWLNLHYSDTWAHPGQQQTPTNWQALSFKELSTQLINYTQNVVAQIQPNYLQIGNELNTGFLHPHGAIATQPEQFKSLLASAIQAAKNVNPNIPIFLHHAGLTNANYFFETVSNLNYDAMAISYYPLWHGKDWRTFFETLNTLSKDFNKPVLIAETAYPFTLDWNDHTHNIIGKTSQIIPEFPPTVQGQKMFLDSVIKYTKQINGLGVSYWGGEWIAWKGPQATDGSAWENQAFFNFTNQELPSLSTFKQLQQ